jgi:methylenetetrahydrofolate reductase (NADPH)
MEKRERVFSFEFFPPKGPEGVEKLRATRRQLAQLKPGFFSVTYGAGGSTREGTLATALEIRRDGYPAAPHISCIASTREGLRDVIPVGVCERHPPHRGARSDLPWGLAVSGEFRYASELVRFIREETGDWFQIEVACYPEYHPQARRPQQDLSAFKAKIDAGRTRRSRSTSTTRTPTSISSTRRGVGHRRPDRPGIMPINNFSQLARFSDACGAEIPRWMRLKLEGFGDDTASIKAFGLDIVTELCDRLLQAGAPGLHFYTLNQAGPTSTIWQRLGL